MTWLALHWDQILTIAFGVASEGVAILQYMKYPTNQGAGGALVGVYKALKSLGAQPPAPPSI